MMQVSIDHKSKGTVRNSALDALDFIFKESNIEASKQQAIWLSLQSQITDSQLLRRLSVLLSMSKEMEAQA